MGHVDCRDREAVEDRAQFDEQPLAQAAIERAERFIEEQEPRVGRKRTCEGHALAFAAGQRLGGATFETTESDHLQEFGHPCLGGALR